MKKLAPAVLSPLALLLPWLLPATADAPKLLKVIPLGVNSADDEDEPHVADRGRTLYYARKVKGKWEIMVSRRKGVRRPWPEGEVLQDYIQTEGDDRGAFVTGGKYPQYLFYATTQERRGGNYDIYVAIKHEPDKAFTAPAPINPITTAADEKDPWLSADGKRLYFSRKTKEGWRVFVSSRARAVGAQGWGRPQLVKDLPADFHHATLTRDGQTMYLQGPVGKGRTGLFVSKRTPRGWGKPAELKGLNHPGGKRGDRSPNLSRDGLTLYFASDRPGGKGGLDLYAVSVADLKTLR
jgi:hypothetical protein